MAVLGWDSAQGQMEGGLMLEPEGLLGEASSDRVGECECPRPGDVRQIIVPLTQGLEQNGSMLTVRSGMAWKREAGPVVRVWW